MAGLRIESDPDRLAPGLERSGGPLPNLTSNRQTEINLRVQVFPSDFCKQLLERYFLSFNGRRDDFPLRKPPSSTRFLPSHRRLKPMAWEF